MWGGGLVNFWISPPGCNTTGPLRPPASRWVWGQERAPGRGPLRPPHHPAGGHGARRPPRSLRRGGVRPPEEGGGRASFVFVLEVFFAPLYFGDPHISVEVGSVRRYRICLVLIA